MSVRIVDFRRKALSFVAIAVWALLLQSGQTAWAQTKLAYKFKQGDKLNYSLDTDMKQSMNVAGMAIETGVNQGMEMSWEVLDAKGESADMKQTITRFRAKMQMPGGLSVDYDSKEGKKPGGPIGAVIGPLFDAMVGAEFSFKMNPAGDISDPKVSDKLLNALKGNPALAQMGSMFSEEGMKSTMQQSTLALPKEAIAKGKTWSKPVETKAPFGKMIITTTYTYQGSETRGNSQLEKFETKSEMKVEPGENADVSVKVKSTDMKGVIYFDNKLGRIVESTQNQKMVMEIEAMEQKFESTQNQTIKMALQP